MGRIPLCGGHVGTGFLFRSRSEAIPWDVQGIRNGVVHERVVDGDHRHMYYYAVDFSIGTASIITERAGAFRRMRMRPEARQ